MLNLILAIVATDCMWRWMNEKDEEMAGSQCLISVLGILYSKEGMPLRQLVHEFRIITLFYVCFQGKDQFLLFLLKTKQS